MPFESHWLQLFNRTITVEPWVSENSAGKVTYGTGVTYRCYILDDVKLWKWQEGNETQSRRTIYVNGSAIGLKDRITMPAGYSPQVVIPTWIIRRDDHVGYHHSEIFV